MSQRPVLLVNPRACSPRSVRLPLSLLALGAVLENRCPYQILDGNLEPELDKAVLDLLSDKPHALVGMTVMPGPQVASSIALAKAIRVVHPEVPIVWGGYFPTLYPDAAMNADYVDFVVRGQGEDTLCELLNAVTDNGDFSAVAGLSWRDGEEVIHNNDRPFQPQLSYPRLPYEKLTNIEPYFRPSFMGSRTGVYQASLGCRYRCTFCGVVSMWNGSTLIGTADRMIEELTMQRDRYGATAIQLYDHNFFDREESSLPLVEALATVGLPWWCYARADTMANFSASTWEKIRRSRLSMAYIGAEAASDDVLRSMKKGSRVEHTLEVARRCRENGVVPEFSFVLGGPNDPEGEIEKTFQFVKRIKKVHPECEVILYFYTPTPRRSTDASPGGARLPTMDGEGLSDLPSTPEEWTEKRWLDFVCHQDAPWLTERIRQRVRDFAFVLGCRFPTIQDYQMPSWGRTLLRGMAGWRWATGVYGQPTELRWAAERLRLRSPQHESL